MTLKIGAAVLSSEEAKAVTELFANSSSRENGYVTLQEALDVLVLMKVPSNTHNLFSSHQQGQSGFMPMEGALQAILKQCPSRYTFQELMHAFTMFAGAEGPSGCITYQALKQALVRNGGVQVLDSDIEKLLAEVVASPHDKIDYHHLISSFYFDSLPKHVLFSLCTSMMYLEIPLPITNLTDHVHCISRGLACLPNENSVHMTLVDLKQSLLTNEHALLGESTTLRDTLHCCWLSPSSHLEDVFGLQLSVRSSQLSSSFQVQE